MSRIPFRPAFLVGGLALTLCVPARAQYYSASPQCICAQPVVQTHYRTVPVTEYRQVKQVVQRPVYETRYVDRQVTAYRPVTETRTAEVPTVTWHNVTENRTVYRDAGFWRTNYLCRHMPSPCEYDPRPGLLGWLNRTGYQIRAAFTPRVVAQRQYVPQVVAQTVPVSRQVAEHGTRQVTYNVTRMEPYTTTQKVAVRSVRYVAEEVTQTQPVTVMRRVPIGTSVAYAWTPYSGTATALAPSPDPIGTARRPDAGRTADSQNGEAAGEGHRFERESSRLNNEESNQPAGVRRSSYSVPLEDHTTQKAPPQSRRRSVPSIVRAGRWMARRRPTPAADVVPARSDGSNGPALVGPRIAARQ